MSIKKIKNYPLTFAENYYIHIEGYIFHENVSNKLIAFNTAKGVYVKINNTDYSLLNLMIEYFHSSEKGYKRVKLLSKKHTLNIPSRLIKFIYESSHVTISSSDEDILKTFKCEGRVSSNNKRCQYQIDKYDVLKVLKDNNMKCEYCGKVLERHKWHLDHVTPIFLGGLNVIENLKPACKTCNLMKGCLTKEDFLNKCLRISKNNNLTT